MTETTGISEVLSTSFTSLSGDMMDAISTVLPIALGIGGAVLVIFLGWKLFKRLTK